jgi:hypothetical protein
VSVVSNATHWSYVCWTQNGTNMKKRELASSYGDKLSHRDCCERRVMSHMHNAGRRPRSPLVVFKL